MLIEEMPRSFIKKNNSYSHCPLKKRPVTVVLSEEIPKTEIKEEETDEIIVDDNSEPENLSTKPEDLSRSAEKRQRSRSPSPLPAKIRRYSCSEDSLPTLHTASLPSPPLALNHHHHAQYQPMFPSKALTPPAGIAPIHPVAKRARVEVLQHESCPTVTSASAAVASPPASLPMHFLNSTVDPLNPYAGHNWARAAAAPLYQPHYLPYASAFRYQQPSGADALYPAYPVPAYHQSEHGPVSPGPQQPLIHRPIAKSYAQWASQQSPDHGLPSTSPTLSLGSSLRSPPPPISPEDLSSPGSDSGRSSAGSVSTGPPLTPRPHDAHHHHHHLKSAASNSPSSTSSTSPRYQCPNCAKSYSTYSGLSKHQQFHCAAAEGQTKKTFSCKYCEKLYLTLGALKMHIRTHTLPCKCHLCGKAFSRPWLLQGHIRTHTGEKPFSCQHCNRAFADRSNLRAHLQTHSDVKKYSCASCSKTFSRMSLLTKHQEGGCPGGVPTPGAPMVYAC